MGWTFGGLAVKKDYTDSFQTLFAALALKRKETGTAFNFSTAISKQNKGTAAAIVNGHTVLLDHLLPYDCSFEEGGESGFDKTLEAFSKNAGVLVFMFDGVSGTYAFSIFSDGSRMRRWCAEPGNILCNDGEPEQEEIPFITGKANGDEKRMMAILEAFFGTSFSQLVNDEDNMYSLFI